MICRAGQGLSDLESGCTSPRECSTSRSGRGGISMGSGLGAVVSATSGMGQGKESSEELSGVVGEGMVSGVQGVHCME